jgi:hypothetical protein
MFHRLASEATDYLLEPGQFNEFYRQSTTCISSDRKKTPGGKRRTSMIGARGLVVQYAKVAPVATPRQR